MPTRERAADRGARLGRRSLIHVGEELRTARVSSGLSLRAVADAAGTSAAQVWRLERARLPNGSVALIARVSAVVGLDLVLRTYPGPDALRDAGHVALLNRFRRRLGSGLRLRLEVPIGDVHDLRAWDGMVERSDPPFDRERAAGTEAETHLDDLQAVTRRIQLKARDSGIAIVILVVSDTRNNRRVLAAGRELLREPFPLPQREVLAALGAGHIPSASGIAVL